MALTTPTASNASKSSGLTGLTGLTRLPNWRGNLAVFLHELQVANNKGEVTFSWDPNAQAGTYNCLTFASRAVEVMTGVDLYESIGQSLGYTTPLEAYRTLRSVGYDSLDQLFGSLFQEVHPIKAQRGDLLLIPAIDTLQGQGFNWAAAVADPPNFWVISAELGLARGSIINVVAGSKAYHV